MEGIERLGSEHGAARYRRFGVHATRAYRRFLVFPSTFILYYNSIRHENAVRDRQTRLSICSRSVGRARFSSRFAFPGHPQLRVRAAGFN